MRSVTRMALAFGAGAGFTYLFDGRPGRRRRALLRDKAVHATHAIAQGADVTARDVAHRARGLAAEVRSRLRGDGREDDDVIAERARAKLGRVTSHPGAIQVKCQGGRIVLEGDVLKREHREILLATEHVRGVSGIDDHLHTHARAGDVPNLQGAGRPRGERFELMQQNWSPAWRLFAGAGGAALALYGLRSSNPLRFVTGIAGLVLFARAATNLDTRRLFGVTEARRVIDIQKSIEVAAPVERVFALWSRLENFPLFMRHVREVKKVGEGRYRWRVDGPGGVPFEWEGTITQLLPNRLLAWKSTTGAAVRNAGSVRFEAESPEMTRLHVRLSYNPPAGAVGHFIAKLFGADPKKELDDDLLRFVSLVEEGKATGREGQVTAEQVAEAR
jgi:uncharacterized membrane protein